MNDALAGIRVLDFTQVISGPYATLHLALQGADVIKVEQPNGGDQGRQLMNPSGEFAEAGQSALFASFNAGKRSMTLDLKDESAKNVIHKLVEEADVLVENFKAGTMERMGFGYEAMCAINPHLVYCSISGYGQSGPRAGAAAYDPVIQATSGMMSLTGFENVTGPTKVGFWVTDMATGLSAAFAMTSALVRRATSGDGARLDVSMLDTAVSLISPMVLNYLNCGVSPRMMGNGTPGGSQVSSVYPTGEGYIQISPATQGQFEKLCRTIERPDLIDNPLFDDRRKRLDHAEALRDELISALATESALTWEARLGEAGVPAAAVATIPEMTENAQILHRGLLLDVGTPEGLDNPLRIVGAPFRTDGAQLRKPAPPPALGQHTDEVLAEAGFSQAAIDRLRTGGTI